MPATESSAYSASDSSQDCSPSPATRSLPPQSARALAHIASIPGENRTPAAVLRRYPIFPAPGRRSCLPVPDDRSLPPASGLPAAPRPSAKAARHVAGEPVPIGGLPAKRVSIARPKTRRDRKTHRKTPPASSLRSPAADFVRSAGCTALLRPFFPDTPPEPHERQEMSTRFPEAAPPPALCAIAKSSIRSQRRARTRSLPQPSSCRTPRIV